MDLHYYENLIYNRFVRILIERRGNRVGENKKGKTYGSYMENS